MITILIELFPTLVKFFASVGKLLPEFKKALIHGVVYMMLGLVVYGGLSIIRHGGDIPLGLRVAFMSINSEEQEDKLIHLAQQQADLRAIAVADRVIYKVLNSALEISPGAVRARLGIIHNGVNGLGGFSLMHFDVTHSVAIHGHSTGDYVQNKPLSDWADYLDKLLADQCTKVRVEDMTVTPARTRLSDLNIGSFIACPVFDVQHRMLGAIFVSWDVNDAPPEGEALIIMQSRVKEFARQIGATLDLRTPASYLID